MFKLDSHQHFWKFDPIKDGWITDEMQVLKNDFLITELEPLLKENGIDGCIAVQADQSEAENEFLLAQANNSGLVKGIVGWVDFLADSINEKLDYYAQFELIKGFRRILQSETKRSCMLDPQFKRGIAALKKHEFTYDILIAADQLQYIPAFVSEFQDQLFVIDHLGKPLIKTKQLDDWAKVIRKISVHENVYCKLSGMLTEADWTGWRKDDFYPYLDVIFEAFGPERVMYGSDWPVCLLAGTYGDVLSVVNEYIGSLSQNEQQGFWGMNAAKFYNIKNND